ncbi:phosphatase PAP2 family protein [Arsenicicoccus sp. oral taxon 190]|uniref:phosphatase PAP2 family protein n=1 Tax=Arsenicicoccus sp. oral taxon 190 TaxID=1658671 RepID=UPI00067CE863|nr:phosphatase PAP2 family protein [Arsenicicoccus sp. oral taxon 190]
MSTTETSPAPAAVLAELHGHARRWSLALAVTGFAVLLLAMVWNVLTPWGQRLDQKAFASIAITDTFRYQHLGTVLGPVEVRMLGVAFAVCAVLALIRRRLDLAAAALVVVVGANATAYLTRVLLVPRPDYGVGDLGPLNSAPSGHAVAAASIAIAIVLVTPMTMRFWVTFAAALWAAWVSLGVVVVRMNRPGDVIAALAVVAMWAGLGVGVAAVLAGRPRLRRALREFRRQVRGLGWQRERERRVASAPYGLTLLVLSGLSAVMVMGVLLVSWGVGVIATPLGILLGIGSLLTVGALVGVLVGATSRAVEKYLR